LYEVYRREAELVLNTKARRQSIKRVTSWVETYDDGETFDGSVGVGLEELIECLPEHARARDHYNDLLNELSKMQNKGREAFCRQHILSMLAIELRGVDHESKVDTDKLMKECWEACDRLWNARYGRKKGKKQ
jgi:hypothetical protein